MKKKNKTYILKESELKEILSEMIVLESKYNPEAFSSLYSSTGMPKDFTLGNFMTGAYNLAKSFIPDKVKEKARNSDNPVAQAIVKADDYLTEPAQKKDQGGPNADAHEVFDVDKAVAFILSTATPEYNPKINGQCARAIRQALNAGGLTAPWGVMEGKGRNKHFPPAKFVPALVWNVSQ